MEPFTLAVAGAAVAGAGAGSSLFGWSKGKEASRAASEAQNQIAALQAAANRVRMEQAKLIFQRQQRDTIRNAQVARSVAISRAEDQGAGSSSVLQGALGQIAGQEGSQLGDLRGNYGLGVKLAGINANITQAQQNLVNAQGRQQEAQGYSDFGKTLFNTGVSVATGSVQGAQVINTAFGTTS